MTLEQRRIMLLSTVAVLVGVALILFSGPGLGLADAVGCALVGTGLVLFVIYALGDRRLL